MGQAIEFKKTLLSKKGKPWIITVSVLGVALMGVTAIYTLKMSRTESQQSAVTAPVNPPKIEAISALGRLEPLGEVINLAPPPTKEGRKLNDYWSRKGTG